MNQTRQYLAHTLQAIAEANDATHLRPEEGYSGGAIAHLLGSLSKQGSNNAVYAEIGVFRGATLFEVARNSGGQCYGIDNFSLFDEGVENEEFLRRKIVDESYFNVELLSMDFELALQEWGALTGGAKISALFVDGPHDYRSQLMALLLADQHMAQDAVMVIDDANYRHVRQATWDFLATCPGWSLLAEITTEGHPAVQSDPDIVDRLRRGWSNGVHIVAKDPDSIVKFERQEPADLTPFHMSHDVFRHRYGPIAKDVLDSVDGLAGRANPSAGEVSRLLGDFAESHPERTLSQNTETGGRFSLRLAQLSPSPA